MKDVPIIVLDFGSQYTQLIARRLRENGVYCEIVPYSEKVEDIKAKNPRGIILSGGPASVYADDAYHPDPAVFELGLPILGICYGMQLITQHFGGVVIAADHHEYGKAKLIIEKRESPIFTDVEDGSVVWMSHGDRVDMLPDNFEMIGYSDNSPYAAIANETAKIYAFQFHPEVQHTVEGAKMLKNFAKYICGIESTWNMGSFAKEKIAEIRRKVGDKKVLCGVSGGVDSTVVATLLHEAIGDQLVPIFVDHGLLRAGEREQVENMFKMHDIDLITDIRDQSRDVPFSKHAHCATGAQGIKVEHRFGVFQLIFSQRFDVEPASQKSQLFRPEGDDSKREWQVNVSQHTGEGHEDGGA